MSKYTEVPMIPGPTSLHPDVLTAMGRDYGSGQIDADYLALYTETQAMLAELAETGSDMVLMTGEGMLALWGGLKSCLAAGDKVLSIATGVFGDGIGDMAASLGCEVEKISLPFNDTLNDIAVVEEAIARFRPRMITAVHCETPSGTLNPLAELGSLKQAMSVPLLYVDAVASLGGAPVKADEWHIDILLGGSQKCLSAPPSMSIVGVSPAAWQVIEQRGYAGYDALAPFRTVHADGRCPYTPYWHGTAALHAAAKAILTEGKQAVFDRHEAVAQQCRNGLSDLGITLFTAAGAVNSPTVTAAFVPEGWTFGAWQKTLAAQGLSVAGSFGPMAGKVFRLGHMGTQADSTLMNQALGIIKTTLEAGPQA
ncbi:pyridoxal-phosphate-dependent aminotransferase family protein [Oleidesulfovibrio sp.]|uniref:pyridoxal-phosphate-dependent aminotransferase family protein n=1 Tax=Oleidesulfovibrio sp. TaxID=2909707 RepID=UPI003A875D8E